MQNVSFKNSRGLTLAGSLWPTCSDEIIIMAHGSGSNRLARGLFEPIATQLNKTGYNVLTFDFSGHGHSDDDVITLDKAVDDVKAAIAFAEGQGLKKISFFGHSLGGYAVLKAAPTTTKTIVLLGAVTGPTPWRWEEICTPEQLAELKTKGYVSSADAQGRIVKEDASILPDMAAIDQKALLGRITCPVLVIHGQGESFEQDLLHVTQKGMYFLPKGSELKIIPEAPHTFVDQAQQVAELAATWYLMHMPLH